MVIQRMQTVFLFIATVLMVLFTFMPFASTTTDMQVANLHPKDFPVYMILNLLIAVLLVISIFTFRNLKQQKKVTLLSMMLIVCSAVTGGFLLYGPNAPKGAVEPCMGRWNTAADRCACFRAACLPWHPQGSENAFIIRQNTIRFQ